MIVFQRFIDRFIGFFIIAFLFLFRILDHKPTQRKKFLLIKLWAIGDSILSLSLIKGIRENFSGAAVDVLTRSRVRDLFTSYPVDHIFNLDTKEDRKTMFRNLRSYDVVFDGEVYLNFSAILAFFLGKERIGFSGQWRSKLYTRAVPFRKDQHMLQNYLDMLRITGVKFDVDRLEHLTVDKNEQGKVNNFLQERNKRKFMIGITPGVAESAKNRMWYEERFSQVADRIIRELEADVIFIDNQANRETVERIIAEMQGIPINATGVFSLKEVFYLIGRCDAYLSNDTGPMHIAAAQGVRTVGLFGPNTPVLWGPFGKNNISIYRTILPPAIQNDKGIFREGNRDGYMGPISVDEVFEAVKDCLEKRRMED